MNEVRISSQFIFDQYKIEDNVVVAKKDSSDLKLFGVKGELVKDMEAPVAISAKYGDVIVVEAGDLAMMLQSICKGSELNKVELVFEEPEPVQEKDSAETLEPDNVSESNDSENTGTE